MKNIINDNNFIVIFFAGFESWDFKQNLAHAKFTGFFTGQSCLTVHKQTCRLEVFFTGSLQQVLMPQKLACIGVLPPPPPPPPPCNYTSCICCAPAINCCVHVHLQVSHDACYKLPFLSKNKILTSDLSHRQSWKTVCHQIASLFIRRHIQASEIFSKQE